MMKNKSNNKDNHNSNNNFYDIDWFIRFFDAVGNVSNDEALTEVCRYRKNAKSDFMKSYEVKDGYICNKKLYIGEIPQKNKTACKIVYKKTLDVSRYE